MSDLGLPPRLLTEIDGASVRETRLTGVDQLARLSAGADLTMAAAARRALEGLTRDDSRSVAAAATKALERTSVRLNPDRIDFGEVPVSAPRLVADVLVEGPPLAVATATVTVSGPGLRAMLAGRRLRVVWLPHTDWLDGSVTVRGPAGWAEVRVTGRVGTPWSAPSTADEPYFAMEGGGIEPPTRITFLPSPPSPERRRRTGSALLVAGLTALVLLGGGGVAVAMTMNRQTADTRAIAGPTTPVASPSSASPSVTPSPTVSISREPLAQQVRSVAKPVVVTTIKVGNEPEGVTVSPDGRTVYVADQSSHVLSVVDAKTRQVTPVTLRDTPRFVATSRDGKLVYVSMYEDDLSGSGMAVLDASTNKVLRTVSTGIQPYALSVAPDGSVWVPIHSAHRLEIYPPGGTGEADRVEVPPNPHAVGFSNDQQLAFTANHESNVVTVIDLRNDKVRRTIPVSTAPHSVAVSPDGRTVIVAGFESNTAYLIDAVTLKRTGPFDVGKQPQSVTFSADGAHAYVVNEADGTVSVLDGHTGAVTATVKVGKSPRTVAVSPDGLSAYVTNGDDDTVSVLRVGS